ncbi:Glycoside hydrolase family 76 [Macrophomina phaseolina MS6]|uniref:mannan endo-1,6-alpha-mannosidase n=1 Tax=Macrophomina phaseolina (strain MS6) TaxID=1126212 RepID=K2RY62_MACPH|nr:Glycoside hydrolase family 76 [Macrophomina phaseolina MS6]
MRCHSFSPALAALVASSAKVAAGLNITNGDPDTLSLAVKQLSNGVMSIYSDNRDVDGAGIFPKPYYWWESGVAWDTLVNYWYLTGDTSNNAATQAALAQQAGEDDDYLPTNQTLHEMNDDQATWALAAMTAAERGFPVPADQTPWEEMARTVFDSLAARWDTSNCGGGLRWSIFSFNAGYEYKNAISQAMFFQLAARLARFTGNQTYIDWAARTYDWSRSSGLIGEHFAVYDGTSVSDNCTRLDHTQWSYTAASFAYGSAILANIVSSPNGRILPLEIIASIIPLPVSPPFSSLRQTTLTHILDSR